MENVESDPKTDRPKVRVKHGGLCRREQCSSYPGHFSHSRAWGRWHNFISRLICSSSLPSQEEIRIQTTTVFVDPYEEADAQVRVVHWLDFLKDQSSSLENFVT